jgi:hypothetical protein
MAIFQNPNDPPQPKAGVYGWYAQKDGQEPITIYVGKAGEKKCLLPTGTLFRAVGELHRVPFTSNERTSLYSTLDTNFIVGTAIRYFEEKGFVCVWKHIDHDPKEEKHWVAKQKPILQDPKTADIKAEFRMRKSESGYWKTRKTQNGIAEAEKTIFSALDAATRELKTLPK